MAVTTVTGMLLAAVAMLVANRLLPEAMPGRGEWEKWAFWGVWLLSLLHALWRSAPVALARHNPAWREQCWAVALLCIAALLLNWITTGDHLLKTLLLDPYWAVAGVDLSLLASALVAVLTARRLARPLEVRTGSRIGGVAYG